MKTIVLLSDFGLEGIFVGVMKGVILKINPRVNLIDLCHHIQPQNILEGAFLLKGAYRYFPKGTIFLAVVDPGVGSRRLAMIIQTENHFFVGPDNGLLSLAAQADGIKKIVAIENKQYYLQPVSDTFHGRDIFAPVAAYLSKGINLSLFGRKLKTIKRLNIPLPKRSKNSLKGKIIYIDRFGNLITNIDRYLFGRFIRQRRFKIKIKNKALNSVVKSYQQVGWGRPLAIFSSFDFLEIAVNRGSAQRYFRAHKDTTVVIRR